MLRRTTAFGYYDDNYVLAVRAAHRPPRRAAPPYVARAAALADPRPRVVLATGAHERPLVFAGQRPARHHAGRRGRARYPNRYGVLAGRRAVVFTTNDSALRRRLDLRDGGRRDRRRRRRPAGGAGRGHAVRAGRHRGAARASPSPAPPAGTTCRR